MIFVSIESPKTKLRKSNKTNVMVNKMPVSLNQLNQFYNEIVCQSLIWSLIACFGTYNISTKANLLFVIIYFGDNNNIRLNASTKPYLSKNSLWDPLLQLNFVNRHRPFTLHIRRVCLDVFVPFSYSSYLGSLNSLGYSRCPGYYHHCFPKDLTLNLLDALD